MKNSYKAYRNSNYFSRDNYPTEPVTTEEIREEEIASPGAKAKQKLVAYFHGYDQGLVLNDTNCAVLAGMAHSDNPADWVGLRIEIFFLPTVKFGKETVGGLRVRPASVPAPAPVPTKEEEVRF
jgi:hypothetical protein